MIGHSKGSYKPSNNEIYIYILLYIYIYRTCFLSCYGNGNGTPYFREFLGWWNMINWPEWWLYTGPRGFRILQCDGSQTRDRSIGSDGFWIFLHPKRIPKRAGPSHFFHVICHDRKVRGLPGIWTVKKCLRRDDAGDLPPWKRTANSPSFGKLRKMNFPLHGCDVECRWYTSMKKQPTDLRVDYNNTS